MRIWVAVVVVVGRKPFQIFLLFEVLFSKQIIFFVMERVDLMVAIDRISETYELSN